MIYSHHISSFCTFDDKNQYYLILNKIRSRFISLSQKTINIDIQQGEKIFSIWHQHVPQEGYSLGLKQTNKQNPLINIWGRKLKILGHGLLKDKGSKHILKLLLRINKQSRNFRDKRNGQMFAIKLEEKAFNKGHYENELINFYCFSTVLNLENN